MRQNYHKFTAEGGRIVSELLIQQRYKVHHLYALASWAEANAIPSDIPLTIIDTRTLGRISQLHTPNEVLAVVDMPMNHHLNTIDIVDDWILYLDGIQSPSNLGALLRIADWFGFPTVIGGEGTADLYNSKSIQASMGSFLRINYHKGSLEGIIEQGADHPIFGASLQGENVYEMERPQKGVLVIGAEGPGISAKTASQINRWLHIPRVEGRHTESLNAAVAAGILCGQLRYG